MFQKNMIRSASRSFSIFLCAAFCIAAPKIASAACTSPPGVTAQIMYNETYNVFQGCRADGKWIALHGNGGDAGFATLSGVLTAGNDAENKKITGLAAPTLGTDAAHKDYVDGKFGTLTNDRWCTSNGTQVICNQTAPAGATPNLSSVLATGNAAGNRKITGLAAPTTGTDAAHKTYVDGKFGTLTNGRWCTSNGTQVICDQTAPTDTLASLSCTTGQLVTKTAGGWGCVDMPGGGGGGSPKFNYFVLTAATWQGGNLGGMNGANAKCLAELQGKNWKGKDSALLNPATVKAFLCGASMCNNLKASTTYIFARAGSTTAGGATILTDSSGLGPGDTQSWSQASHFGVSQTYWTNRDSDFNNKWENAASGNDNCDDWSDNGGGRPNSGAYGTSNSTNNNRWEYDEVACTTPQALICIVDSN